MSELLKGGYAKDEQIFREYILKDFLGEGSFGRVYLVKNSLQLPFALKVMDKGVQMEKRGLESVMKIRSNRLVSIQDFGKTVKDEACVLMEYLPVNLESLIEGGSVPEARACGYFTEILRGLKVLEANNIVHRDIKPENLFLLEDIIKIGDFGTAKYTSGKITAKTSGVGTLHYMAPECFRDKYSFSVDRWAAAVIFYRMLTGYFLFDGTYFTGVIGAIMTGEPELDLVPEKYGPFLKKCFEKNVNHRHKSADEMLKEAENIFGTEQTSAPDNKKPVPEKRIHHLRSRPIRVPAEDFYKTFGLNSRLRPLTYIKNKLKDNKNGTVTDLATGLMWQKSGSETFMEYKDAHDYIRKLNQKRFAGYRDWRLPTLEELISLLEEEKQANNMYIDPIFDPKHCWCWSSDKCSPVSAWHVHFDRGYVHHYEIDTSFYVRGVRG